MPDSPASPGSAPRGRPTAIDPAHLAAVAIALFAERGYDAVSMTDIADAAGIGRRSLFRYFPSKADLIWDGFLPVQELLRSTLAASDPEVPPFEALTAASLASMSALPDLTLTRTRLRIIAEHPELIAFGSGQLHGSSERLVAFLRSRGVEELRARVTADALTTASFNAYVHWATRTDEPSPEPSVRRAHEMLAALAG